MSNGRLLTSGGSDTGRVRASTRWGWICGVVVAQYQSVSQVSQPQTVRERDRERQREGEKGWRRERVEIKTDLQKGEKIRARRAARKHKRRPHHQHPSPSALALPPKSHPACTPYPEVPYVPHFQSSSKRHALIALSRRRNAITQELKIKGSQRKEEKRYRYIRMLVDPRGDRQSTVLIHQNV